MPDAFITSSTPGYSGIIGFRLADAMLTLTFGGSGCGGGGGCGCAMLRESTPNAGNTVSLSNWSVFTFGSFRRNEYVSSAIFRRWVASTRSAESGAAVNANDAGTSGIVCAHARARSIPTISAACCSVTYRCTRHENFVTPLTYHCKTLLRSLSRRTLLFDWIN